MEATELSGLLACFAEPPHPIAELAACATGAEAAVKLMELYGGQKMHVSTLDAFVAEIRRKVRDEEIRARFRGNNTTELADAYKLTPRMVRLIVHGQAKK